MKISEDDHRELMTKHKEVVTTIVGCDDDLCPNLPTTEKNM